MTKHSSSLHFKMFPANFFKDKVVLKLSVLIEESKGFPGQLILVLASANKFKSLTDEKSFYIISVAQQAEAKH